MRETVPDIPRIYTAIAEWCACTLYITMIKRRINEKRMGLMALGAFFIQLIFMQVTGSFPLYMWIPCMVIAIFLMFIYILNSGEMTLLDAAYATIRAFVLAELLASLNWQIYCYFWPDDSGGLIIKTSSLIMVYVGGIFVIRRLERPHMMRKWHLGINMKEFLSALLIGIIIFLISNMSFVIGNTPFSGQLPGDILNIRTLVDIGGFAILYAHNVQCSQIRAWREVEAVQSVLQNQYVQYRQSRESIDLINRKYHDLKHQIGALRQEEDPQKRNDWLDEIENDIKTYEAQNKTGNTVLDTVLTGKSMYCQKHNITLTCVADGTLLNFMDVMDLCSVFGNALDNAIECEKRILEKEKRLIHVTVSAQKKFVLIRFENYYEGKLEFEDGLPITTKPDINFHGYGLKSIKRIAETYGGTVSVNITKGWFELKVLMPLQ